MSRTHLLKTQPPYFGRVADGSKTFEVRFNDRDFQTGDHLCLQEWNPDTEKFTGFALGATVSYMFDLRDGRVVLALKDVRRD